jgi:hypothetical protein
MSHNKESWCANHHNRIKKVGAGETAPDQQLIRIKPPSKT